MRYYKIYAYRASDGKKVYLALDNESFAEFKVCARIFNSEDSTRRFMLKNNLHPCIYGVC